MYVEKKKEEILSIHIKIRFLSSPQHREGSLVEKRRDGIEEE